MGAEVSRNQSSEMSNRLFELRCKTDQCTLKALTRDIYVEAFEVKGSGNAIREGKGKKTDPTVKEIEDLCRKVKQGETQTQNCNDMHLNLINEEEDIIYHVKGYPAVDEAGDDITLEASKQLYLPEIHTLKDEGSSFFGVRWAHCRVTQHFSLPYRKGTESPRETKKGATETCAIPADMPAHITEKVAVATLTAARKITREGVGERLSARGIVYIIGNAKHIIGSVDEDGDPKFGRVQNPIFDFRARGYNITELEGETWKNLQAGCKEDGAIVIDGVTGDICCATFLVTNLTKGTGAGGARTLAASSIARQAGNCYVIKASEDICGSVSTPPPPDAHLEVFPCTNEVTRMPV